MKNAFKALTLIAALVLLVSVVVSQAGRVSAQVLGTVAFKDVTATSTATAVSFGTNDTSSTGAIVAVHVTDVDLAANTTTVKITSNSDSIGITVTLTNRDASRRNSQRPLPDRLPNADFDRHNHPRYRQYDDGPDTEGEERRHDHSDLHRRLDQLRDRRHTDDDEGGLKGPRVLGPYAW